MEDKILELRKLFNDLPQKVQRYEAERFKRVAYGKPAYFVELDDVIYKLSSIESIRKLIKRQGICDNPDKGYISKALSKKRGTAYGLTMYKKLEVDDNVRD